MLLLNLWQGQCASFKPFYFILWKIQSYTQNSKLPPPVCIHHPALTTIKPWSFLKNKVSISKINHGFYVYI